MMLLIKDFEAFLIHFLTKNSFCENYFLIL